MSIIFVIFLYKRQNKLLKKLNLQDIFVRMT